MVRTLDMNSALPSLGVIGLGALLLGCGTSQSQPPTLLTGAKVPLAAASTTVALYAVVDLPRTNLTHGLSATAFDPATRTLYALQDHAQNIVPLLASSDYRAFTIGAPIPLTGRPDFEWDGEGLIRLRDGFIAVTDETTARVERFDTAGKFLTNVVISSRFSEQAIANLGLESLTISPSGRFLFTANEAALKTDGLLATKSKGTTVRIHQRELATGADRQAAYRTEPLGAGLLIGLTGVSELAAISDRELLVLERGYQPLYGNTVRIFRVDLATGIRVEAMDSLTPETPVLTKQLVVDLATLPSAGITHPGYQPNPILDNYEALAIGPAIPDGRRLLFVTSDDNSSSSQVARVLVLAVPGL